jgi:hypothetical protein
MWRGKVSKVVDNQDMHCSSMIWEYIAVVLRDENFRKDIFYDAKEVVMYFRNDRNNPPNHPYEGDVIEIYRKKKPKENQ